MKDIKTDIIMKLHPYINANKEKSIFHNKTLATIDKYWPNIAFYERFY